MGGGGAVGGYCLCFVVYFVLYLRFKHILSIIFPHGFSSA